MIGGLARTLSKIGAGIDRLSGWIAFVAIMVMLGAMMLQIVARYIFAAPPVWTEELARYAMIWACMLGAGMAYYRRADPVLFRPKAIGRPRLAIWLYLIDLLAVIALVAPVLWFAPGFLARHMSRITETLEFNSAVVVSIIPLSLLLIVLHSFTRLIVSIHDAQQAKNDGAGQPDTQPADVVSPT